MAEYEWAYTLVDSSRISTFFISILLIVYGSFRSLNMDQEAREREKERERQERRSGVPTGSSAPSNGDTAVQMLDGTQAVFLPIGASISLLIMFFFFDSMQMLFATCTAIIATVAFAFLLLPMCQYIIRPCSDGTKVSFGCCGRFTSAELMSFSLSFCIVCIWVLTGHWLLMDALGMGLCVAFIAFVRLPSLKVSTLLLTGLLIYDVFWVFFSSFIFNANVMVKVATRPAENPVGMMARKFHLTGIVKDAPKLSLPGKLVFPSMHNSAHFSMLGLGDIVMPGLLLCFVLRYDAYKRSQLAQCQCCCCHGPCSDAAATSTTSAASSNSPKDGANMSSTSTTCDHHCTCTPTMTKATHSEPLLSASSSSSSSSPLTGHSYKDHCHHHHHHQQRPHHHHHYSSHSAAFSPLQKVTYFHCSLIGYFLGLLTATVSSEVFKAAQPALLYLVPFTLLPLLLMAYMKGDLKRMWHEPFLTHPTPSTKFMDV